MKRVFLGLLVAGLIIANNCASPLAARSSAFPEACPLLPVRIVSVEVTPQGARSNILSISRGRRERRNATKSTNLIRLHFVHF